MEGIEEMATRIEVGVIKVKDKRGQRGFRGADLDLYRYRNEMTGRLK
jgi:hypothetical protein